MCVLAGRGYQAGGIGSWDAVRDMHVPSPTESGEARQPTEQTVNIRNSAGKAGGGGEQATGGRNSVQHAKRAWHGKQIRSDASEGGRGEEGQNAACACTQRPAHVSRCRGLLPSASMDVVEAVSRPRCKGHPARQRGFNSNNNCRASSCTPARVEGPPLLWEAAGANATHAPAQAHSPASHTHSRPEAEAAGKGCALRAGQEGQLRPHRREAHQAARGSQDRAHQAIRSGAQRGHVHATEAMRMPFVSVGSTSKLCKSWLSSTW